ncbi:exported protein (TRAP dicarboxylate transporter) [Bordetella pertussis]|nr:exported protein (TRAP dicarboxylate transporter) [Bordetella pertussis]
MRQAVLDAGAKAEIRGWQTARAKTRELTDTLARNGMSVEPLPPQLAKELQAIGATMVSDWSKKAGADGQQLLDAYRK